MSTDQNRPESPDPTDAGRPMDETQPIDGAQPIDETQPMDTRPMNAEPMDETQPLVIDYPTPTDAPAAEPASVFAAPTAPTTPSAPTTTAKTSPARPTLRVGTVVWGLVLAVIGAGVIAVAAGAQFDLELAFIGLLVLAGVALLAGSIATSVRRRNR